MGYCNSCHSYRCSCKSSCTTSCNTGCLNLTTFGCTIYDGPTLTCLGIRRGDTGDKILSLIDEAICAGLPNPSGHVYDVVSCSGSITVETETVEDATTFTICLNPAILTQINNNTANIASLQTCCDSSITTLISSDGSVLLTDNGGGEWDCQIANPPEAWNLIGNSGTDPLVNFIGTSDAQDLVFRINNVLSGLLNIAESNTSFGYGTFLSLTSGGLNTAIGTGALFAVTSGARNTAVGVGALGLLTTGGDNTSIGGNSGTDITTGVKNTLLGYVAGLEIDTGSNNTCIGDNSDVDSSSSLNRIALGKDALATSDFQFALPDNVTSWKIRGNSFTLPSADGTANQSLVTNGSGVLSFATNTGNYTPTLTNVLNVAASTSYPAQWMRVGNVVTVSGKLAIDATASGSTTLDLSLPVASNFSNDYELGGVGSFLLDAVSGGILANSVNNRASLQFQANLTGNMEMFYTYTYTVI